MSSTVIAKNVQIGADGTASNNFTIFQPATPDGTLRIGNGNTGITSSAVALTSAGNVGIGTSSPGQALDVRGRVQVSNGTAGGQLGVDGGGLSISGIGSGPITFAANTFTTNLVRIASDGSQSSVIPGGSTLYPQFACRAWVNFNGTGTVAIRASGNVSSITDNATGDYTVNFTTAMSDANYAVMSGPADWTTFGPSIATPPVAASVRLYARRPDNAAALDRELNYVSIFR